MSFRLARWIFSQLFPTLLSLRLIGDNLFYIKLTKITSRIQFQNPSMNFDRQMMRQAFADCKATCEKEIQSLDDDIAYFQTIYLLKTRHHGNLLKGFDEYKDSKIFKCNIPRSPTELKNEKIESQERIFSLTSVTCKANSQYQRYCQTLQEQESKNWENNRNKFKTEKPARVIRKVKTGHCQTNKVENIDESESQTPPSQNKLSVQTKQVTKIQATKRKKQSCVDADTPKNVKLTPNIKKASTKRRRMRKTLVDSSEQEAETCKMINKKVKLASQSESSDSYENESSQISTPKKRRLR